jgi:hypothetical protein
MFDISLKGLNMKQNHRQILPLLLFLFFGSFPVEAQQPNTSRDDELQPEAFTTILKYEWMYLRDGVDQLNKETEKRGEFETTPEFQDRVARLRRTFLDKLNAHIKDNKLEQRLFGVWFKAKLVSYDADVGIYSVKCDTNVEAPYNIPTVTCFIPPNPYVDLADSILGGYRTSKIYLKFDPDFKWTVARDDAMAAKGTEGNIVFKVHFILNITQEGFTNQALLRIIPKDIMLMNQSNKYVYWKEEIKPE